MPYRVFPPRSYNSTINPFFFCKIIESCDYSVFLKVYPILALAVAPAVSPTDNITMNYDGRDPYQMNNDDICGAGDPDGGRGTIMRSDMDARVNDVVNDECYNHGSVSLPSTTSPDTYDVRDESHRETLIQVFSAWAQGFREMMEEAMCWEAQKSLSDDMHGLTALLNVETDKVDRPNTSAASIIQIMYVL